MAETWIDAFDSTQWTGAGELWLDPEGNEVDRSQSYQPGFEGCSHEKSYCARIHYA